MSRRGRTLNAVLAVTSVAAVLSPSGAFAGATVTGTDGRDEVSINTFGSRARVTGALSVTGQDCVAVTDTLVNRTVAFDCPSGGAWTITLGGGDDLLDFDVNNASSSSSTMTADGGVGADVLSARWPFPRTLRGGDGDDVLIGRPAPSDIFTEPGATLDGGAGRDQVDYGSSDGVSASLATSSALVRTSVSRDVATGQPGRITTRTDSFLGIERLSGSPAGDVLTGAAGPDELLGQAGFDTLTGGAGNDTINGGPDSDVLDGGDGADAIDGGPGRDTFTRGTGGDTITSRDGFAETVTCVKADTIVSDLVDRLASPELCGSVSVAAAKHAFDTQLLGVSAGRARVACPAEKTEPCVGTLRLRRGGPRGRVVGRGRYRVAQGKRARVAVGRAAASTRLVGMQVTLQAAETDLDRRPRSVTRALRVAR